MNSATPKHYFDDRYFESYFNNFTLIPIPDNSAIQNGVITLTGGYDREGIPLVVFPMEMHLKIQMNEVSKEQMFEALIYYFDCVRIVDKTSGLAFLVDFRTSSSIIINTILSTIKSLQESYSNCGFVFYGIKPKSSKLSNEIKKGLDVKLPGLFMNISNASETNAARFKSVLVKNSPDLYNFIDPKCLTNEFGGRLLYSHNIWLLLKQDVYTYLSRLLSIKDQFPKAKQNILKLKKYKIADTSSNKTVRRIEKIYNDIIKNVGINQLIGDADALIDHITISVPTNETAKFELLRGNPHLETTRKFVADIRENLIEIQNQFQDSLIDIKKRFSLIEEFRNFTERASDEVHWIQEIGIPTLKTEPKIALNSDEAESMARDFHNNIFIPGIRCISRCEEIIKQICDTPKTDIFSNENPNSSFNSERILSILSKFNNDLQERRKTYSDIYQFHCILVQVRLWMKKTMKNIPIDILEYEENMNPDDIVSFSDEWKSKLNRYLVKHPSPKETQLYLLENTGETIQNVNLRNEVSLLAYRLKILLKLFTCNNVTVENIREIIDWKYQLKLDASMKNAEAAQKNSGIATHPTKLQIYDKSQLNHMKKIKSRDFFIEKPFPEPAETADFRRPIEKTFYDTNTNEIMKRIDDRGRPDVKKEENRMSRSQPNLYNNRNRQNRELIELAERTVRESLRNAHLISGKDLRIPKFKNDEDELSLILNQLLYDIGSSSESSNGNLSAPLNGMNNLDNYFYYPNRMY